MSSLISTPKCHGTNVNFNLANQNSQYKGANNQQQKKKKKQKKIILCPIHMKVP
jgi:hypothetical protein